MRWPMLACLLGLFLWVPHSAVRAQALNRAALVVSYGEGKDVGVCVSFSEEEITGYELLQRSGLTMESEPSGGFGEAVCLINGTGCDIPQQKCFCECQGAECSYWSYWRLEQGAWTYSQQGSSLTTIRDGSADAWVWGSGTLNQSADRRPPDVTFGQVCTAAETSEPNETSTATITDAPTSMPPQTVQQQTTVSPTATPSVTPIATATPTQTKEPSDNTPTPTPLPTAMPTAGPTPTVTLTPFVPPTIRTFAADRPSISFGESSTLVWDVADATSVILRYPGGEEQVPAQGSKAVSPQMTTQYGLFAASPVGDAQAALSVEVNAVISAPTADPNAQAAQPAAVAPTQTWTPTWTPTSTPTWTPEPTQTPQPTWTPQLPPTQLPASAPSVVVAEAPGASAVQLESPLVVTVVVTLDDVAVASAATAAPAIVLLDPVGVNAEAASPSADDSATASTERAFMVGGLAFVIGIPVLFAGIWTLVWLVWRRR